MLLGMDAISQIGGVWVPGHGGTPRFGRVEHQAAAGMSDQPASVRVEDADFTVSFDGRCWTAAWKWKSDWAPPEMIRQPASYASAKQFEDEVDQELSDWKKNGWLIPFTGEPRAFLPLMAIEQAAKGKVRPVLDYRAVNEFVSSHIA